MTCLCHAKFFLICNPSGVKNNEILNLILCNVATTNITSNLTETMDLRDVAGTPSEYLTGTTTEYMTGTTTDYMTGTTANITTDDKLEEGSEVARCDLYQSLLCSRQMPPGGNISNASLSGETGIL